MTHTLEREVTMVHVPRWQLVRARPEVLAAAALAGVVAATALRLDRPGIGWLIAMTGVVIAVAAVAVRQDRPLDWPWALAAVALMGVGTVRAAEWLFVLCALASCGSLSLAVTRVRTLHGILLGGMAIPFASLSGLGWVGRGLAALGRRSGHRVNPRLVASVAVSLGLLVVFGALFAGADAAFAELLLSAVPKVDGGNTFLWLFLFLAVGLSTVGACYLLAVPLPAVNQSSPARSSLRRLEWALPVGALVLLFAAFVAVQIVTLFGGSQYVLRTANLSYADYARGGFWQLAAITVLTLVVIAVVARLAPRETERDRLWLRILPGALAVLTLVVVASALTRMWAYQEAYGFTVMRLLVQTCELWLGAVYLLVLAAGVRLRGQWLAQAVVGTAVAALLGLAAINPERLIAEQNIARSVHNHVLDSYYLGGLSTDAAPALATVDAPWARCRLHGMARDVLEEDWRSWNLSRSAAREQVLDARC
ncbi:hypothetical protein KALB_3129 [Kutzneria albida DSM 43870]|uniref:Uncharacterized protein n=2 Tax=Kutzneria TaxID=43356 RepID=W5W7G3_9PSEU|nr:hypothetical protein KALB_3129 [Kutzneria albida DSM 43870]